MTSKETSHIMQMHHRTAEDWAERLATRVLRPDEFDGIAVSRDTRGWGSVDTTQLDLADPAELQAFLVDLRARRQLIAGVLPADEQYPVRIVVRSSEASQPPRRARRRSRSPSPKT
jgi:hypothetical protein